MLISIKMRKDAKEKKMVKIVGVRQYKVTDKETNQINTGCTFFFEEPIEHAFGKGLATGKFSLSTKKITENCPDGDAYNMIGKVVTVYYNQYKSIERVIIEK